MRAVARGFSGQEAQSFELPAVMNLDQQHRRTSVQNEERPSSAVVAHYTLREEAQPSEANLRRSEGARFGGLQSPLNPRPLWAALLLPGAIRIRAPAQVWWRTACS